jgi:FdhE protein
MPRILEPGQIEAFAERAIPRLRLPEGASVFAARARRLRQQAAAGAPGQAIGDYLRLMAAVVEAQALVLGTFVPRLPAAAEIARAHAHGMPPIQANGWSREDEWRALLGQLCRSVGAAPEAPPAVREACERLRTLPAPRLEDEADALLALRAGEVELVTAPFVMAGLQVYWMALASRLAPSDVPPIDVPGVCPVCGTLPVASIVRSGARSEGYRYLHCALCATEWHLVRITCSQCQGNTHIAYHSIGDGAAAIRAESCDDCHSYRKILYQEKDPAVEPVADDLASLAIDLLMAEAGYHRASGNPLLWQESPAPAGASAAST